MFYGYRVLSDRTDDVTLYMVLQQEKILKTLIVLKASTLFMVSWRVCSNIQYPVLVWSSHVRCLKAFGCSRSAIRRFQYFFCIDH